MSELRTLDECQSYADKKALRISETLRDQYAWRWLHFDLPCKDMGGFANFSHYICNQRWIVEIETLQTRLEELQGYYAESVARECKCKVNVGVNSEIVERNLKLRNRLKEAEEVIDRLNSEAVGKEYGLDSEDIWEISREYLAKYKEEK